MKKDNSILHPKLILRRKGLESIQCPIILEAFAGKGVIYSRLYSRIKGGCAIEKKSNCIDALATLRPTWTVLEGDNVSMFEAGVQNFRTFNFLDFDAYGSPWESLGAYFRNLRDCPDRIFLVVTDGLRQNVQLGGAWSVKALQPYVPRFGNDLYGVYLELAREMLRDIIEKSPMKMIDFFGLYAGHAGGMTLYSATLEKRSA